MTDYEYQNVKHIMDAINRQHEEDNQLALLGYVVFLLLGFTLGAILI